MKIGRLVGLLVVVGFLSGGCAGWSNTSHTIGDPGGKKLRIRDVKVDPQASFVKAKVQPTDADARIEGWTFVQADGGRAFLDIYDRHEGVDTTTGERAWVVGTWYVSPISPGTKYYFQVTAEERDGDDETFAIYLYDGNPEGRCELQ